MKRPVRRVILVVVGLLLIAGGIAAAFLLIPSEDSSTGAGTTEGQTDSLKEQQHQNPLTGEVTDQELSNSRPVAIAVENAQETAPQWGLSEADIVYEMAAEENATQILALYLEAESVPKVGPVAPVEEYDIELADPLCAAMVHFGGSEAGYTALQDSGLPNVDGLTDASAFTENPQWTSQGASSSCYTSSELLLPALEQSNMQLEEGLTMPFLFSDISPSFEGTATQIQVAFSDGCTAEFIYDADTGCYQKNQWGSPQLDGNTGQPIQVTNLLLLYQSSLPSEGRSDDSSTDESQGGMGVYACGGEYTNVRWNKESAKEPFSILNSDGDALTLRPGKTWVCILPQENRSKMSIIS